MSSTTSSHRLAIKGEHRLLLLLSRPLAPHNELTSRAHLTHAPHPSPEEPEMTLNPADYGQAPPAEGWFPDPTSPGHERRWNGTSWTNETRESAKSQLVEPRLPE